MTKTIERLVAALKVIVEKPSTKWEHGKAFQRFKNDGWSESEIAASSSFKERYIREAIELHNASHDVKVLLSESKVSPAAALAEVRKSGKEAGEVLRQRLQEAQASGKTSISREKAQNSSAKVVDLAAALFGDVTEGMLSDSRVDHVLISRKRLVSLLEGLENNGKKVRFHE